jgi:LacI family transcriptional regulator
MRTRAVTLKDLAQELGLSRTTVSRALNGFDDVNPETRDRIAAVAKRYGYRPNPVARKLATGRAGMFGIVFPTYENLLFNPHFTEFLIGAVSWGSRNGVLIALGGDDSGTDLDAYRRILAGGQVDGVIVSSPLLEDPRVPFLLDSGLPFLVHGRTRSDRPFASLDIDNEGAFHAATKLLTDMGHRRIALLNGDVVMTFATHRLEGYRTVLRERGLDFLPDLVFSSSMTEENGYRQTLDALDRSASERPTAFLCSSATTAQGCYRALRERGLRVPQDCSVIAHDDCLPSLRTDQFSPPLTTTRSPIRDAGEATASLLQEIVGGRDPLEVGIVWPVDLVVRESVAPPPA